MDGNDSYRLDEDVLEVVWGGGGNDSIRSLGEGSEPTVWPPEGDYICGGPGNDSVYGYAGDDHIRGGGGNDTIDGWEGNDVELGNAGDDRVAEDVDQSNLGGRDLVRGGRGDDIVGGSYKVYGGRGSDDIYDPACSVTYLNGGPGSDYFESYQSYFDGDTCDAYVYRTDEVIVSAGDTVIGGAGFDRARLSAADEATGVERITRMPPYRYP